MEKLYCSICNLKVESEDVDNHIKTSSHISSKKKLVDKKEEIRKQKSDFNAATTTDLLNNVDSSVYSKWKE